MTRALSIAVVCLLSIPATAQINYKIRNGAAAVVSSPNASGNIVIAATYDGYPITEIAPNAFYNCTNLTSITFPNGLTNIGNWLFNNCTSLTNLSVDVSHPVYSSVEGVLFDKSQTALIAFPTGRGGSYVIPNTVTNIGQGAFRGCIGLTNVAIPHSVRSIGDGAFINCTSLTSANIPDGVPAIGAYTFLYCTSLTSVTLGNNVTNIWDWAFSECENLAGVTIGSNLTRIERYAFAGCTNLANFSVDAANPFFSSVDGVLFNKAQTVLIQIPAGRSGSYVIPDSVARIEDGAFSGCIRLTNVAVGSSVTQIPPGAFSGCTGLISVTLPNTVTNIAMWAFSSCTSLASITIPNGVTNIADGAFSSCTGLTNVSMANGVTRIGTSAFFGCTRLTSVTIGVKVTSMGNWAFSGCTSLTSFSVDVANPAYSSLEGVLFDKSKTHLVAFPAGRRGGYSIPDGVTSVGYESFAGCSGLTNVAMPNSVISLGESAFAGCSALTSITIPNSVISIARGAFSGCTNLSSVIIPNSVTWIGEMAFSGCTSLTNFSVDVANPAYSSRDGALLNKAQTILIQVPPGRGDSYGIPNSVTSIEWQAFSGCSNLTSVTIGDSVTGIGDSLFSGCLGLRSVTLGNNVTSVGYRAFSGCTNLTSVTLGTGITNIGESAFSGCTALMNVTIPNSTIRIEMRAFSGCTSLSSVIIPKSVTWIGELAFSGCTSLTNLSVDADNPAYSSNDGVLFNKAQTVLIQFPGGRGDGYEIPNSVTNIESQAFSGCSNLTRVTIPNNVTSIEWYAFSGCIRLASVTLGNNVTSVGYHAFSYCPSLTNLTFHGQPPVLLAWGLFDWFANAFNNVGPGATVYYFHGTVGWGQTYGGLPAVMLGAPAPQLGPASAGAQPGAFGFTVNGVVNQIIVIEGSTNLVNWQPIWTNTLSGASASFVDPQWLDHPTRFYRARSN